MASKAQPIVKPRLSSRGDNRWFCCYGMHTFESTSSQPIDCPEFHASKAMIDNEMTEHIELKRYFLDTYPNLRLGDLSLKQIKHLMQRIAEFDTQED